jgi:hypothetical protein
MAKTGRPVADGVQRAVKMVLRGMLAEDAWAKCGKPTTLANIRRRANDVWKAEEAAQALAAIAKPAKANPSKPATRANVKPAASGRAGKPAAKATLRPSRMVEADEDKKEMFWAAYFEAHQAATREYILAYCAGNSCRAVAAREQCEHVSSVEPFYVEHVSSVYPCRSTWSKRERQHTSASSICLSACQIGPCI